MSRYFKMNRKYFKFFFEVGFCRFFDVIFPLLSVSFVTTTSEAQAGDVSLEYKSVRGINYKRENTISALHYIIALLT